MVKVGALTSGKNVPSARFRLRQFVGPLAREGVVVHESYPRIDIYSAPPFWPENRSRFAPHFAAWQLAKVLARVPGVARTWTYDVTWLERELFPSLPTLEPLLHRPLILDVDDAIWLRHPRLAAGATLSAHLATTVLAGNEFIADWFSRHARDVRIVPTAIDTTRFKPAEVEPEPFTVSWTGSGSTLPYLESLEGALDEFLKARAASRLLVICDRPPRFKRISPERVRFVRWSEETEAEALRQSHVGLMPLPDTAWSRGKCSFKMLQSMACGLPVVVSPIGMNDMVLRLGEVGIAATTTSEWVDALLFLADNETARKTMGLTAREVVEQHFSVDRVTHTIASIIKEVAGH